MSNTESNIETARDLLKSALTDMTGRKSNPTEALQVAQTFLLLAIAERLKGVELHVIREEP